MLSGTSADAIDVAICRIAPTTTLPSVQLISHTSHPHDPQVHAWIAGAENLSARRLAELQVHLGQTFGRACLEAIDAAELVPSQIDLVGSHGQTLYHYSHVPGAERCTLQVGDADQIAEITGLPVVADFRARDIAAGGEGAPISPIADLVLYRPFGPHGRRAILNIGGIANITLLDENPEKICGFDTGPGNALLDRLARRLTGGATSYDMDGRFAAAGTVNAAFLGRLLDEDAFLRRSPPKSTGFEMYGDAKLEDLIERHGGADANLMATLAEFTAQAVGRALTQHVAAERSPGEIVLAGGGARNADLVRRITAAVAPRSVTSSDVLGVPIQAREAMAFAVLAHRTILGLPSTWPCITGARHPVVLGKLSLPRAAKP
jgi:anhydro-N-acetylmuramic acid kinase